MYKIKKTMFRQKWNGKMAVVQNSCLDSFFDKMVACLVFDAWVRDYKHDFSVLHENSCNVTFVGSQYVVNLRLVRT